MRDSHIQVVYYYYRFVRLSTPRSSFPLCMSRRTPNIFHIARFFLASIFLSSSEKRYPTKEEPTTHIVITAIGRAVLCLPVKKREDASSVPFSCTSCYSYWRIRQNGGQIGCLTMPRRCILSCLDKGRLVDIEGKRRMLHINRF